MMTKRFFLLQSLAAFAVAVAALMVCTLVMASMGVGRETFWRVVSLGIAGFAALLADAIFDRVAINRELDRRPRVPCLRCGYPLDWQEDVRPLCPECGTKAEPTLP